LTSTGQSNKTIIFDLTTCRRCHRREPFLHRDCNRER
jgi:hypothetical protein